MDNGGSTEDDSASSDNSSKMTEKQYLDATEKESNEKAIPIRKIIQLD